MRRWFVQIDARRHLARQVPLLARSADVYIGCAPRQARSGQRQAVPHAWVAWVDADGTSGRERVAALRPAPTLVVASGSGGVHGYWRLTRPADAELVEEINRRLAHAVDGDPVWAITTILRPPGSRNLKRLQRPAAVRTVSAADSAYDPDELLRLLPPVPGSPAPTARPTTGRPNTGDALLAVAPRDYVQRLLGVEVPRSGFIACPWHPDERPSLRVYETPERGWYCYSAKCRRGGSIYDLASDLFGIGTRGAEYLQLRSRLHDAFPECRRAE